MSIFQILKHEILKLHHIWPHHLLFLLLTERTNSQANRSSRKCSIRGPYLTQTRNNRYGPSGKINFDEPNNSLIVSLVSYRKLFVFQDNVRYSHVVRFNKLRPSKLPYVVKSDEKARYKMTRPLRKSIKPKRKHIFKSWIKYEGLQPQPTEYKW